MGAAEGAEGALEGAVDLSKVPRRVRVGVKINVRVVARCGVFPILLFKLSF